MSIDPEIPKQLQLYSAEQSRNIDRETIEHFGIDGFTLMEIAAKGAADHIQKEFGLNKTGLFVCGKGNNAGDALAAARYLTENADHKVILFFVFGMEDLSPNTQRNFALLQKLAEKGSDIEFISDLDESLVNSTDYIIDGIFGTGLSSEIREPVASYIKIINDSEKPVISMDVPSGLHPDSGVPLGTSIQADITCSFGTQKMGHFFNPGKEFAGRVVYVDLPFPRHLRKSTITVINNELSEALPSNERKADHKYQSGVVHLIAGSKGLVGAAIMAAKSAWKSGAGSVILYAPENLIPIYESVLPHIIKVPLPGNDHFIPDHIDTILEKISNKPGILLIGPGIGLSVETKRFVSNLLLRYQGPAVIDADALSEWENLKSQPDNKKRNWILTPHAGEASKFLGLKFKNDSERFNTSKEFSDENSVSLLMKGNPTFYHSVGKSFVTGYDTTPFTRAGFGDVLAGTIATKWGITDNIYLSPVMALLEGYDTYSKKEYTPPFGPEHLL
ncbi:NAD(P)H-hydrate dehydratase [Rhodohalobacter barkolensis]|uniref:NAD(P)H-hydrate epimerase n=1 Tax=Rhodohalobacter barkolensis TaxID=2053187 RepID=A0A2N0VMB9_9BACT|nr:NAD(P)H-hydrate dehydratase [Rhodohalobacter barkolensis]PKD45291.1 NAD(P)H-hydrate epimerase [Rhodohalobacter barkolensis]